MEINLLYFKRWASKGRWSKTSKHQRNVINKDQGISPIN
jgi:hypothetical protein